MATYQIETDKGTYQVETDEPTSPSTPGFSPKDIQNEEGLQNVSMTPITQPDLEKQGEDIATSKFGQAHPTLGPALGTVVAKAPEFGMALSALGDVPEMAEGVAAAGTGIKNLVQKGSDALGGMMNTLKAPSGAEAQVMGREMRTAFNPSETLEKAKLVGQQIVSPEEAKVTYMQQQLKGLPQQTEEKLSQLEEMRKTAGKSMSEAEKEGGFDITPDSGYEEQVASPKKMRQTLDVMGKWANMNPQEIADTVDPKTINLFRKLSKGGQDQLSDIGRLTMQKGETAASDALSLLSDKFADSRSQYKDIMQTIDDLKDSQPLKAKALQRQTAFLQVGLDKANQEASNLMAAARTANAAQRADINQKALDLLKQGIQHDAMMKKIYAAAGIAGAAGAAKTFIH